MNRQIEVKKVESVRLVRTPYETEVWVTVLSGAPLCEYLVKMSQVKAEKLRDLLADCIRHV